MRDLLILVAAVGVKAATMQLSMSSSEGSDGPWEAFQVSVVMGDANDLSYSYGLFYPSLDWASALLSSQWSPEESSLANETEGSWIPYSNSDSLGDDDGSSRPVGTPYVTYLLLDEFEQALPGVSVEMLAADTWDLATRNGSNYTQTTGILGFGSYPVPDVDAQPSIIQQLMDDGNVSSNFLGLHMGSASLGPSASLTMGGYERNRAIGDTAIFDIDFTLRVPKVFLIDMVLGVEIGGSPFDSADISSNSPRSVWQEVGDDVGPPTEVSGAASGTAPVWLNPTIPYMHLPSGNCDAIAEYLPVSWDDSLGYYIWDTEDPSFERIVESPAYLGFVFSDREVHEVTIKVPMKLLNLTLDSPIVPSPIQYFPCQEKRHGDFWELGRAFLQAAFLGFDYDRSQLYLAQAPGPTLEQVVLRDFESGDESFETSPADSFAASWLSEWIALPGGSEEEDGNSDAVGGSLSAGATAGVAVGSVVAVVALIAVALFFKWRRRRAASNKTTPAPVDNTIGRHEIETAEKPVEKDAGEGPKELQGSGGAHEAPGSEVLHELPGDPVPEPGVIQKKASV